MKRMLTLWLPITLTVLATLTVVLIYVNLTPAAPGIDKLPVLDHAARDPQFRREVDALFATPLVAGNRIETLQNGVEIFPAMLEAIRAAGRSINFETFVYWRGDIADEFSHALAERAQAGIEVNVILDWAGSMPMDEKLIDHMENHGVRVEAYRPLAWYSIDRFNHRTHRKILVVDGRIGFTGGVGIAQEWTGNAEDDKHYRDTHYRVDGPAVAQLQAAFNENWQKVSSEILFGERHFPTLEPAGDVDAQFISSAPGTGNERARIMYLHAIAGARESLVIGTPYLVPDALVIDAVLQASERGVDVKVLVPGSEIDSAAVRHASRRQWGDLLQAGIEIYEYQPTLYHCKVLVVDGYWTLVGSTNVDSRSLRLNDEINLNVMDATFAETQLRAFENDLKQAKQIDYQAWSDRPLRHKLAERLVAIIQGQL